MPPKKNIYEYVSLSHPTMRVAYYMAKGLYEINKWNLKTTPVALIVNKKGRIVASGVCAEGAHPKQGICHRLGKAGTPYTECAHCMEEEHAERKALNKIPDLNIEGYSLYLYGHYKICETCSEHLKRRGVKKFYLLENADVLFDRHNPGTVLGKEKQFIEE